MTMLFRNTSQSDPKPRRQGETHYAYLERSSHSVAVLLREKLEEWFALFPIEAKVEIASRIRSGDEANFESAFFELYLNALLRGLGYTLEAHPESDSVLRTRPDFLVKDEGVDAFYLEATVATELSRAGRGNAQLRESVLGAVSQIESPNFFLNVRERGRPTTVPSSKKLTRSLSRWLSTLDPDEIMSQMKEYGFQSLPSFMYRHEDWAVELSAMPKPEKLRGQPGVQALGVQYGSGFKRVKTVEAVKAALGNKIGKYGRLDLPYIVAVNALAAFGDGFSTREAIFGSEALVVDDEDEAVGILTRKQDGVFSAPDRNTRLSAALVLHPTTIAVTDPRLFHNPSTVLPVDGRICLLSQGKIHQSRLEIISGMLAREALNVDADWLGLERPLR